MTRSTTRPLLALACMLATVAAAATTDGGTAQDHRADHSAMLGFTASGADHQKSLEQRFDAQLNPAELRDWLKQMSSAPNQVGSPHDKANAEFMLAKFREWGWNAHIETFSVLYPTPKKVALALLGDHPYTAALSEPPVPGDTTSAIREGALPPYNVYGADGDVTGQLVYANYGMPDDYKDLARRGIDVRGKIVLSRYGGGWRGLKPKLAQQHGAIGCLIYSDPHEDGYARGDVYPEGGWRPSTGVQRGSVADMQVYPGDPLTPGIGSVPGAKRLALKDAVSLLKIPVLPISYADATPLLQSLAGPVAPAKWRGSLPLTYHIGPGTAEVHMTVLSDWGQKPVYDVIAKMKGSTAPDQWIVRGNHHDGWVFGAWDPLAGNVAMLAEAKAIGALVKQGWRPQRTLVYAGWDGEEPGLLGSTEWVETHARELQAKAVMYVNSDTNGRGFLDAGGSHSLQRLVNQVTDGVTDPQTHVSVRERLRAHMLIQGNGEGANEESKATARLVENGGDVPLSALGSGSDFSAFLEHLGIASLNLGFGDEDDDEGIYHSRYDSFDHYVRFGDPTFEYGVALSQVAGHVVLRSADASVLPMNFGDFSSTLNRYVDELHKLVDSTRKATDTQHKLLDARAFALDADPARPVAPPERDSDMPAIDLAPLDQAAKQLAVSAKAYDAAYSAQEASGFKWSAARQREVSALMGHMEQGLTDPKGLPTRPWFKHMVYAPGMLTGYGVKTIPGVREALEARRWDEASQYGVISARVIDRYRAQLDQLTALLRQSS